MIGWLVRATISTVVVGAVGYVVVAIPIGRHTLFEHLRAIAHTRPARDLAEDVSGAARAAADRVRSSIHR